MQSFEFYSKSFFKELFLFVSLSLIIGVSIGGIGTLFLWGLAAAENFRDGHHWIVLLLPLGGFLIAMMFRYWGKSIEGGNNLIIENIQKPKDLISFKMAPLIILGTIGTHLFGGSAGREGTAVQMGASTSELYAKVFKLKTRYRRLFLMAGMAGGFAAVFGTPLAGVVFGLEVFFVGALSLEAIVPAILTAVTAYYTTHLLGAEHSVYKITESAPLGLKGIIAAIIAGLIFGWMAKLFSWSLSNTSNWLKAKVKFTPLIPVLGGVLVVGLYFLVDGYAYLGLGVSGIQAALNGQSEYFDFFWKFIFTWLTLSTLFKGGEVTPLFFIGATLGASLSLFLPLPGSVLAAMGFVAVFAGAANTPLACIVMGMEIFGTEHLVYIAIACVMAYFSSGHQGIYKAQKVANKKYE